MSEAAVTHATVLFTDLVGSTAIRARLGEELADELRRVHDALLSTQVEQHGGTVVKGLGDGILATFPATADAVSAAVAIQQAAAAHGRRHRAQAFEVRIGLSAGDVSREGGDVFGTPVVEASRLCATAAGGQILAAQLVELLARGRGDHRFSAVGDLELKGIPQPVPAVEIAWSRPPVRGGPELPPALTTSGALPFSGRVGLMEEALAAWKRAQADQPGILLLAGEPGAGKTRLAAELAVRVHADGATVLYGHCDESLDTAYLAVVESLRGVLVRSDQPASTLFGPAAGRLTRILPELLDREPDLPVVPPEDPETDRYRTLTAVGQAYGHLAGEAGALVVLDDLHWADRATVQVLRLLTRTGLPPGVLIVGTYRDTDVDPTTAFGEAIGELRRQPAVERVAVGPLDRAGISDLLDAASGDDAYVVEDRDRLADLLVAETEGNVFFVSEMLRHLLEIGALVVVDGTWRLVGDASSIGVPEGVRDVLGRRLALLGDESRATLVTASVIGPRFDCDAVASVAGVDVDVVLDHLDAAAGALLVDEEGVGRYRFTHALVRASLYDSLSATRRARLHAKAARHLEVALPGDVDALAHHWSQAASTSSEALARAIDHSVRSGRRAVANDAPDSAIVSLTRALELAQDADDRDDAWRAEVHTDLAIAERRSGGFSMQRLERAARLALDAGRPDLAGNALLEDRLMALTMGDVSAERRALVEDAVEAGRALPIEVRASLLALLAGETLLCPDQAYRDRTVDAAMEALRGLDRRTHADRLATGLARIAYGAQASLRNDLLDECEQLLEQVVPYVGGRARYLAFAGLGGLRAADGRIDRALADYEAATAISDGLGEPFLRAQSRFGLAQMRAQRGDLRGAREALAEFETYVALLDDPDLMSWPYALRFVAALQQGDLIELEAEAELILGALDLPAWHAAGAAVLALVGRGEQAHQVLDRLAALEFGMAPLDIYSTGALAWCGLAAARLESPHRQRIAALVEALDTPFCTCNVNHVLCPPYVAGLLRRSLGDLDAAVERFRAAAGSMRDCGARGYEAMALAQLSRCLVDRGRPGDQAEAASLAAAARATAAELGTGEVHNILGIDRIADRIA